MGNDLIQITSTADVHPAHAEAGVSPASSSMPAQSADFKRDPGPSQAHGDGKGKAFFIETFGCAMNVHDSEKVAGTLLSRGYRAVDSHEQADLILYNTCSIREKAAEKVFSYLGALKKATQNKPKVIGVLGCVAQQEGEAIFERAPQVSLICGSASYTKLPELLDEIERGNRRVTGLDLDTDECFETELTRRDNPFRAYLTIIEGCDQRCAFCVVPYTRGPERGRPSDKILAECRRLAGEGFGEIQLLGQIVNAWEDPSPARLSFAELLGRVAETPGVRRVRFTTSHPRYFTPDIVEAIDSHPALCEQVHLPVQSGSSAVLARMLRGYTREQYLEKIDCIRRARRAISISTDIIVGFCGETREDFEQTMSLLDAVQFDQVFSFKYSPRPNTAAGSIEDSVSEEEKSARLAALQERQRQIQLRRNQALMGQVFEVLAESFQARLGQVMGRTSSNRIVNFPGTSDEVGQYVKVRTTSAGPNSLVGEEIGDIVC
jgi:tRNA-2-methylthio-N6-dimethylallyladenosine synthase